MREPSSRKALPPLAVLVSIPLQTEPFPHKMYYSLEWAFWPVSTKELEALGAKGGLRLTQAHHHILHLMN